MELTIRARELVMIAAAAATCVVTACATASSGGPAAASSAAEMAATPAGSATAGSATATPIPVASSSADSAIAGSATATPIAIGGSATAGSATATPVPVGSSPSPTGLPTTAAVTPTGPVTQDDRGQTYRLTVGQEITVVLASPPRMWDQPTAQGSAVTRVSASGGYPSTSPAGAVFRAVAPGTAQLTSSTDMPCEHQTPRCLPPDEIWTVSIVVAY